MGPGAEPLANLARRLLTIPDYAAACAVALASAPLWIPAAALVDLARCWREIFPVATEC